MDRALTAKTNLDALKNDAKRWLKALRADDAPARKRLAAAWPKAPSPGGRLTGRIAGRGRDGAPACASVPILPPGWLA